MKTFAYQDCILRGATHIPSYLYVIYVTLEQKDSMSASWKIIHLFLIGDTSSSNAWKFSIVMSVFGGCIYYDSPPPKKSTSTWNFTELSEITGGLGRSVEPFPFQRVFTRLKMFSAENT